ncbi:capping protein (actin filament), gelsolin-like b isoform X1 [Dunckerocampus dactyliophorus]|uniref:capping protein (actin filament), gelsolin-like b isoform X1 n=2 Tax=Dunckerocampus dactyliophorus TaxID=161453 RepID=UPI00240579A0|nr:capping protein (actin filament), gelsolin-like b isoform X1 [Dunckerocampus dactyliophorus]
MEPESDSVIHMLAFQAAAGQFGPEIREPGLHAWRVEKMKAVPLLPSEVGAFYNGDSYLVLENRGELGADLHMWIGEKSSRDEQVACAMLATQLDNFLGGDPIQHRHVQGYESPEFMKLFPRGVSYKDGGVESGFRRSQGSGTVRRLYQIKGKRNIRAKEVELSWKSFNKGDCFILDLGEVIVSWTGSQANVFEKQKVREIASLIRDTDRHGKARIVDTCEGEEPEEMLKVLGQKPELAESSPEEDSKADISNTASLYKVSDATGSMSLTKVEGKSPFAKELLLCDDCFILDNGANGKIFVWKGSGANAEEKDMALQMADNFIEKMTYPMMKTQVEILPQGKETVMFKQFFKCWN